MATVAHSGRQARAATSMMERLPPDLMVYVLELVELPERLRLSMCSTMLLKLVTRECTPLWVNIVFYSLKHAKNLTDDMLAALLTRVNARNVTKYLDLDGCSEIHGMGLAPLRHSRVFERIDLRTGKDDTDDDEDGDTDDIDRYILDETVVVDILRTMLPYGLFDVIFYPVSDDVSDSRLVARKLFFREIRAAMHQRAIQQCICCTACHSAVCEESRQIVANELGLPSTRCYICREHFCRTNTCPMAIKQCRDCEDAFCEKCDAVEQCNLCACYYCDECREVSRECSVCQGKFCGDCRSVHTCECCNTTVCEDCAAEED